MNKRIAVLILIIILEMCTVCPLYASERHSDQEETAYTYTPAYHEVAYLPTQPPSPSPSAPDMRTIKVRPFKAEDQIMLARLVYIEARGVTAEKWGVTGQARQAAVIWCVLNRVDDGRWGNTIADVVTAPDQFAYDPEAPVEIELLDLVYDVLCRWEAEKEGQTDVGRTLPREYMYFGAEYGENYFRLEYETLGDNWEWSLEDPYK